MNEDRCYMPIDITIEEQYISGYGKKEIKNVLKTSLLLVTISLVLSYIFSSIMFAILSCVISVAFSALYHKKMDITNLTAHDYFKNIIRFVLMQKTYHYRYYDEWRKKND